MLCIHLCPPSESHRGHGRTSWCRAGLDPAQQGTPGPAPGAWLGADRPHGVCTPFNGGKLVTGSKAAKPGTAAEAQVSALDRMRPCWEHPMQPNSKWGPCEKSSWHTGNPPLHVVPRCRFTYRLVAAPQVNNQLSSPSLTKRQLNPGKKIPGKHACRTQPANPVSQLRALQTPWRKLLQQSRALCAGQVSCTAQPGEHFE